MPSRQPQSPQHFTPPTPRELRAQAAQRLQVGLFGVAVMLLVVALVVLLICPLALGLREPGFVGGGAPVRAANPAGRAT